MKLFCVEAASWFRVKGLVWTSLGICGFFVASCRPGRTVASAGDVVADEAGSSSVKGEWDWGASFRTKNGDLKNEEEAWLLNSDGSKVTGRYRRRVTVIASGNRAFQCNGLVSYQQEAVYQVSGTIHQGRVKLVERSVKVVPSPCDSGQRRLDHYSGKIVRGRLVLSWGGGHEVLHRRSLTGVWFGVSNKPLPNGDMARVQERWRIRQTGDMIVGVRDRKDIRLSNDQQRYRCNQRLKIVRMVRWPFTGTIRKGRLYVTFGKPMARTSPCEKRNLKLIGGSVVIGFDRGSLQLTDPDRTVQLVRQQGLAVGVLSGVMNKEDRQAHHADVALRDRGVQP